MAYSELGEVKHRFGEIWSASGKLLQAATAYQEAVGLQRQVTKSKLIWKKPRQRLVRHLKAVADIHRQLGQLGSAIEAIAEVEELVPGDSDQVYWYALQFALCHIALDSKPASQTDPMGLELVELSISTLRHACEVGFDRLDALKVTPELDSIRETPQFKEFLATLSPGEIH